MILAMGITLYTSRIVLAELGVTDFGVYNVVAGVVTMFSVLNTAMASSTQRYLTFELGKDNEERINAVFNTSVQIHFLIAISVALITELLGLWFLNTKMQIPIDKMSAANWVFQFSILSMIISFFNVPYTALIIAYEKMNAFAFISILEVVLKLISAYLLIISPIDKLKFYAILTFLCPLIIRVCYWYYCKKNFKVSKVRKMFDKALFKEMTSFAGWGLFGQLAAMSSTQGVNIILNLFFGPAINAARGIAIQVQSAVTQLSANFQTAINPQITKNYAKSDFSEMHKLMYRSSKFSFYLLYSLALPIIIEAPFILNLWLEEVPKYTVVFIRIILWITIIDGMANPLMVAAMASGKIIRYQILIGGLQLIILPLSYIVLKIGAPAYSVFIVNLLVCAIAFVTRLGVVAPLTLIEPKIFFRKVIVRCFLVSILSFLPPFALYLCLDNSFVNNITIITVSIISAIINTLIWGLTKTERSYIFYKLKQYLTVSLSNEK